MVSPNSTCPISVSLSTSIVSFTCFSLAQPVLAADIRNEALRGPDLSQCLRRTCCFDPGWTITELPLTEAVLQLGGEPEPVLVTSC